MGHLRNRMATLGKLGKRKLQKREVRELSGTMREENSGAKKAIRMTKDRRD